MADYKENSRRNQTTVITNVTFILSDGSEVTIDVSHFEPQSEDDIQLGIENRRLTLEFQLTQNNV